MEIYLVGGAVRDKLMGIASQDKDWVVVGATPQQMLKAGFRPVGKDFPVFLHPTTNEEYALARTERKTGVGYNGFTVYANANVSLEQDLARRDLTINAIAAKINADQSWSIIDPFNGQADLQQRVLRHVSSAFSEDPLRILRLARLYAKFTTFSIANETKQIISQMISNGELKYLVAERVWAEFSKGLTYPNCVLMFDLLMQLNALPYLWPELAQTYNSIKTNLTTALTNAIAINNTEPELINASLCCYFALVGNNNPLATLKAMGQRMRIPSNIIKLTNALIKLDREIQSLTQNINSNLILHLYQLTDALRQPERFNKICQILHCTNPNKQLTELLTKLRLLLPSLLQLDLTELIKSSQQNNLNGLEIANLITQKRSEYIAKLLAT